MKRRCRMPSHKPQVQTALLVLYSLASRSEDAVQIADLARELGRTIGAVKKAVKEIEKSGFAVKFVGPGEVRTARLAGFKREARRAA